MNKKIFFLIILSFVLVFGTPFVYSESQDLQPGIDLQTNYSNPSPEPVPTPAPGMNPKIKNNSNYSGNVPPAVAFPSPSNPFPIKKKYNFSRPGPLCPNVDREEFNNFPYPWQIYCNPNLREEIKEKLKECWDTQNEELIIFGNITCGKLIQAREGEYYDWEQRKIKIEKIREERRAEIEKKVESLKKRAEERRKEVEKFREMWRIKIENYSAYCDCNLTTKKIGNWTTFCQEISDGGNSCVKIMPDVAGKKAIESLNLKNCESDEEGNCILVLKEASRKRNNENIQELIYEVKAERKAKLFGFINSNMDIRTQISAEDGEIVDINKPWWSFLASEESSNLSE